MTGKTFKDCFFYGWWYNIIIYFWYHVCIVRDVTYPETISRNVLSLANYYEFCLFGAHTLSRYFRDGFSNKASVQGFLKTFLFINGPIFLLHLLVGVKGRNVKKIPSLLSTDYRYIWLPIATYLIFFIIPAILMVILKYNDKKRKNYDKRKPN